VVESTKKATRYVVFEPNKEQKEIACINTVMFPRRFNLFIFEIEKLIFQWIRYIY